MMSQIRVFTLAVLFLSAFVATAQEEVPEYTVQVGNYANPKPGDFAQLQSHGFLYSVKRPSHTDIFMGGYMTEKEANEALATLQLFGYGNAAVSKLNVDGGQSVAVIQLATKRLGEKINWEEYLAAGQLYVLLSGKQLKLFVGTFPDVQSAKGQLAKIQKVGFKDAFVRSVNNVLLHEVGDFEMGGAPKRPLIPLVFEEPKKEEKATEPAKPVVVEPKKEEKPKEYDEAVAIVPIVNAAEEPKAKPAEVTPKGVETPADPLKKATEKAEPIQKEPVKKEPEKAAPKEANPVAVSFEADLPDIRPNVKRTSAYELQKALKTEGSYKGSLDGFYGKSTRNAYDMALANNRQLQKYRILAKYMASPAEDAPKGSVQYYINTLWDDPKAAVDGLAASKAPIARAYRAYFRYVNEGQSKEVNWMMNEAIKEAFAGKKPISQKFDPTVRYAYEDIDQMLMHLRYIHEASPEGPSAPCWLFRKHPSPAMKAFGPAEGSNLKLQACGGFWEWEEVKVLDAIARDLNGASQTSEAAIAKSQSQLAQLYLTPKALSDDERKALEAWNAKLWQGIEGWSSRDPMLAEIASALKISYLQTEVLFEDFFMDEGFNEREAKALGLQAMKVLVAHHLERFI
jgi:outer membrane biosynthesis protein TonB